MALRPLEPLGVVTRISIEFIIALDEDTVKCETSVVIK